IIAAFAFLVHFLAIGAMYSDWLDPIVDEELSLAGLVDTFDKLPPPPPIEEKVEEVEDTKAEQQVAETPKEPVRSPSSGKATQEKGSGGGSMSSAEVAALSNELDQLSMLTLGALA